MPACGRLSVVLHRIVGSMTCSSWRWVFRIARTVWRLGLFVYPSNWTLVSIMSWTQRCIFPPHKRSYCLGSWYARFSCFWCNVCYHIVRWFVFFVCQTYAVIHLNFVLLKREKSLFWEIVHLIDILFAAEFFVCFIICISFLWWSFLESPLCTTNVMNFKRSFKRNLTCLTELSNFLFAIFFIVYPQYFLSRRASALVHPHRWSLILLEMEKMFLATTFTWWEVYSRKYGFGISSSSFTLHDLRTWL